MTKYFLSLSAYLEHYNHGTLCNNIDTYSMMKIGGVNYNPMTKQLLHNIASDLNYIAGLTKVCRWCHKLKLEGLWKLCTNLDIMAASSVSPWPSQPPPPLSACDELVTAPCCFILCRCWSLANVRPAESKQRYIVSSVRNSTTIFVPTTTTTITWSILYRKDM